MLPSSTATTYDEAMKANLLLRFSILLTVFAAPVASIAGEPQPNFVLVMADDMGWGETGYYNHPVLKTPHLDAMAAGGLRFDRFYAGASNCSPTRATVLTGRTNDRTGVTNHGVPLRPQEYTIAQALAAAGYATAHFGKWHLNGLRGPGVPILGDDIRSPGRFGFQTWLSATNFFDVNPILSREGKFAEFIGDSSEIVVAEALKFIGQQTATSRPFFTVIWYGSPHSPFRASDSDKAAFDELDTRSANHYGELVAMDRSIGTLRAGLRELKIAQHTFLWFCSDNGGLPNINPDTLGGLRGFKNTLYEGGLRVPAIIEWPGGISIPRITMYPACTMDIFPTLMDIAGLPLPKRGRPLDGVSLKPLLTKEINHRERPIGFRHAGRTAFIDNNYKLLRAAAASDNESLDEGFALYDLATDAQETQNVINKLPEVAARLKRSWTAWNSSVDESVQGLDYQEQAVVPPDPGPRPWKQLDAYRPYFDEWQKRPEYRTILRDQVPGTVFLHPAAFWRSFVDGTTKPDEPGRSCVPRSEPRQRDLEDFQESGRLRGLRADSG